MRVHTECTQANGVPKSKMALGSIHSGNVQSCVLTARNSAAIFPRNTIEQQKTTRSPVMLSCPWNTCFMRYRAMCKVPHWMKSSRNGEPHLPGTLTVPRQVFLRNVEFRSRRPRVFTRLELRLRFGGCRGATRSSLHVFDRSPGVFRRDS